jgi:hypothetical protein
MRIRSLMKSELPSWKNWDFNGVAKVDMYYSLEKMNAVPQAQKEVSSHHHCEKTLCLCSMILLFLVRLTRVQMLLWATQVLLVHEEALLSY